MNFGESLKILLKTMPYLIIRVAIYLGLGLGAAIFLGFFLWLASVFESGGVILFLIALGVLFGILKFVQRYVLYLVKAGHVAVITEMIHTGGLPEGVNQLEHGKKVVTGMFKEVSVLFLVDQLVAGILKAFSRAVVRVADFIPIPGLESAAKFVTTVINFSLTYVDESILSYNLSRKDENIWESSKRGVILYAQNWKPILKSAFWITIVNIIGFVALVLVMLIPFAPMAMMASSGSMWRPFWLIIAVAFGYGLKLSIINPLCLISMIITFNRSIEGQEPNPEWESKLDSISSKFRELKEKARDAMGRRASGQPATAAATPASPGIASPPPITETPPEEEDADFSS